MIDYKNTPAARAVKNKYSDILPLSRPEPSHQHPRMSLLNRAKIFSPFAALRGYDEEIAAEGMEQLKVTRIELPEEDKEKLAVKLGKVRKGMEVTVRYFENSPASPSSSHTSTPAMSDHTTSDYATSSTGLDSTQLGIEAEPVEPAVIDPIGYYRTITGCIDRIDPVYHKLRIRAGYKNDLGKLLPLTIRFEDILELKGDEVEGTGAEE